MKSIFRASTFVIFAALIISCGSGEIGTSKAHAIKGDSLVKITLIPKGICNGMKVIDLQIKEEIPLAQEGNRPQFHVQAGIQHLLKVTCNGTLKQKLLFKSVKPVTLLLKFDGGLVVFRDHT